MNAFASMSGPAKGIALMVAGGLVLTLSDTATKWLAGTYPVGQIMGIRALFTLIPIALFVWQNGGVASLRIGNFRMQFLRAACAVASAFLFVSGLVYLPLADCIALAFSGPLFVTAMATPLLAEQVGWRRWTAVCVGFAGVLVMIRPTSDAMHWAALLPLCAASMGALRDVVTRRIRMSDSPVAILAFTMGAVALAGFATLPLGWKPVAWDDLLIMATAGILVGSAQYLMIYAFHVAEASLIIPFKYLTLIWGAVFGFMVWGHIPDQGIVAGSVLVVGSGLYIMHRETRMHRRRLRRGG